MSRRGNKDLYRRNRNYRGLDEEQNGYQGLKYRAGPADRYETAMKSGPVKTWADMTPGEREKVLASLKGRK